METPRKRKRGSRSKEQPRRRRGAAVVEGVMVLMAFLTLLVGLLDFSLAVLNRNTLEAAACRLARTAVVRGRLAATTSTEWGPATMNAVANDGTVIAGRVRPLLAAIPPAKVNIRLEWPDGNNSQGDRVKVTLTYAHKPIFTKLFGTAGWSLRAVSVMRIQH